LRTSMKIFNYKQLTKNMTPGTYRHFPGPTI
jgi:hypothetical protein